MNLQKIFEAVRNEPDQPTIIIAVRELEKQGYSVIINDRYHGTKDLILADEINELRYLATMNGVKIKIRRNNEVQIFRIHFLDIDRIAFTESDSLPIQINNQYSIELYKNNN